MKIWNIIKKKYKGTKLFIIGEKIIKSQFSEDNKKYRLAELIFIFNNLPKNGNFILKFHIKYIRELFINLFYLMYKSFKKLYFYKTLQNLYSNNFYIIGINYTPVSSIYLTKMKSILSNYSVKKLDQKIVKEKYPKEFIYQIYNVYELFVNNYIYNIDKQLYYIDNAKYIPKEHYDELKKINDKNNSRWIKMFL